MSDCKTGAEHIKSLKDGRTVYIDGKLVGDVTEHPAFRNAVAFRRRASMTSRRTENPELMTFQPNGSDRRVNRGWQMPRELRRDWCSGAKRCRPGRQLVCGFSAARRIMSRPRWSASAMGIEVFRKHGADARQGVRRLFRLRQQNDLFLTYVIVNPQADRSQGVGRSGRGSGGADRR